MLRRTLIVVLLCAAAGVFGRPALAANPPVRPVLPFFVQTPHFKVWYSSDPLLPGAFATQTQASDLAAMAERAYATYTSWGYSPPPDDGDGRTDVFIVDMTQWPGVGGVAIPDGNTVPSTGSIDVAKSQIGIDWENHVIAHELFHLIQFGSWLPSTIGEHWLLEGEAEWAGYKLDSYEGSAGSTDPPDLSLDCFTTVAGKTPCAADSYVNGGYSRWSFYEYLTQRFGNSFLKDVLTQAQSTNNALAGLSAAIAAKGTTLAAVYDDFSVKQMTGGWGIASLDGAEPKVAGTVVGGTLTADLGTASYSVDHLATRYVQFQRGDGAGDHPCFAATLTITVGLPAGVTSQPYFFWNANGSAPVALSVSGTTATTTVPWDTCLWTGNAGYLSLPNQSTNVDAAPFTVSAHVTVDQNTPASATAPADQLPIYGGITAVANAEIPPVIALLAPLLLHVSASDPTLRLIVQSTGDGALHAVLAGVDLGSPAVRAGNNDLRFAVPQSLLTTLRRTADASNLLTLTPVSPSGTVTGTAVTRTVALQAAPKAAAKATAKPKAKPKPKKKK